MTENVLKEKNKLKEGKLLKPKIDVVFYSLFRVGNEDITKAIISDITKEEIENFLLHMSPSRHIQKLYVFLL